MHYMVNKSYLLFKTLINNVYFFCNLYINRVAQNPNSLRATVLQFRWLLILHLIKSFEFKPVRFLKNIRIFKLWPKIVRLENFKTMVKSWFFNTLFTSISQSFPRHYKAIWITQYFELSFSSWGWVVDIYTHHVHIRIFKILFAKL